MSVISKIKYFDGATHLYPKKINGKPIDKINVCGLSYNFAESASVSGGATARLTDSVLEPLRSYSIQGKSVQDANPSRTSPKEIKSVLSDGIEIYSSGTNLFCTDYHTHTQAVTYERLSSNSFSCYGSFTSLSGIVRFDLPKVTVGNYYMSFNFTARNTPDVSRRNEILIWSVTSEATTVRTVFSCGGDAENVQKGFWIILPEDCELRLAWYTNMVSSDVTYYYAKLENISLTKGTYPYEDFSGRNYISITEADLKGENAGSFSLNKLGEKTDVLSVDNVLKKAVYKKNTEIKVLTGNESWRGITDINGDGDIRFYTKITNGFTGIGLCSHFVYDEDLSEAYTFRVEQDNLVFRLQGFVSLANWTSFIQGETQSGNPITILYAKNTETEYEITDQTVKNKLLSLNSFKENTQFEVAGSLPPDTVGISYWKKIN